MTDEKIINYIDEHESVSIPELQNKFNLSYKEAKAAIDELVESNKITYVNGIYYEIVRHDDDTEEFKALMRRFHEDSLAELERDSAERGDDDDEDDYDEVDEEVFELRRRALKLCVDYDRASTAMFQRVLRIGYPKAKDLIEWLEEEGYISRSVGRRPRRVLISREDFNRLFSAPDPADDDDEEEDEDTDYEVDDDDTWRVDFDKVRAQRKRALKIFVDKNQASASLLCRTMNISEEEAKDLMAWMTKKGYITIETGCSARKVLITAEEFERKFSRANYDDDDILKVFEEAEYYRDYRYGLLTDRLKSVLWACVKIGSADLSEVAKETGMSYMNTAINIARLTRLTFVNEGKVTITKEEYEENLGNPEDDCPDEEEEPTDADRLQELADRYLRINRQRDIFVSSARAGVSLDFDGDKQNARLTLDGENYFKLFFVDPDSLCITDDGETLSALEGVDEKAVAAIVDEYDELFLTDGKIVAVVTNELRAFNAVAALILAIDRIKRL